MHLPVSSPSPCTGRGLGGGVKYYNNPYNLMSHDISPVRRLKSESINTHIYGKQQYYAAHNTLPLYAKAESHPSKYGRIVTNITSTIHVLNFFSTDLGRVRHTQLLTAPDRGDSVVRSVNGDQAWWNRVMGNVLPQNTIKACFGNITTSKC